MFGSRLDDAASSSHTAPSYHADMPQALSPPLSRSSLAVRERAPGPTAADSPTHVTPPGNSKQARRASDLAGTVYAGVKQKMASMKAELLSLRDESTTLRAQLEAASAETNLEKDRAQAELDAKLVEAKAASELSTKRHLGFIDRLLADKQELTEKYEALTGEMRALETRYANSTYHACPAPCTTKSRGSTTAPLHIAACMRARCSPPAVHAVTDTTLHDHAACVVCRYEAGEAQREEAYAKELRKQREVWAASEKVKRDKWLAEKTKEVKDATVRARGHAVSPMHA